MKTAKSQNRVPNETKSLNCGVWEICEVASSWDSANGTVAPGDPVEQCNVAKTRQPQCCKNDHEEHREVANLVKKKRQGSKNATLKKPASSQKRNLEEYRKVADLQPCGIRKVSETRPCGIRKGSNLKPCGIRKVTNLQPCGIRKVSETQPCARPNRGTVISYTM